MMARAEAFPIFTVGHSNRTMEEFADLLKAAKVDVVVDVRTVPRSRANPQYGQDRLPGSLREYGLEYRRIEELGGLRGRSKDIPPDVNGFWQNRSFQNYADHALGPDFRFGLTELLAVAEQKRVAIMCAEAVWWRCHRRIIADHLLMVEGREVFHVMGRDRIDPASPTPAARLSGGMLVYPAGPEDEPRAVS